MGCFIMLKGKPNKRYTPEFKRLVIETMLEEKLGYRETARGFSVSNHHRIQDWERIYLTEGPEGFGVEWCGRGNKGRPRQLPKEVEEDLLAGVQRLRAENEYLKTYEQRFLRRKAKSKVGHRCDRVQSVWLETLSFSYSGSAQRVFGQLYHL